MKHDMFLFLIYWIKCDIFLFYWMKYDIPLHYWIECDIFLFYNVGAVVFNFTDLIGVTMSQFTHCRVSVTEFSHHDGWDDFLASVMFELWSGVLTVEKWSIKRVNQTIHSETQIFWHEQKDVETECCECSVAQTAVCELTSSTVCWARLSSALGTSGHETCLTLCVKLWGCVFFILEICFAFKNEVEILS